MTIKTLLAASVAVAGLLGAGAANATLYEYTYVDSISSASTPGISVGDTFTTHLFINSASPDNQVWSAGDTDGFTISAGTYHASYSVVWQPNFEFDTDGSGNATAVQFYGTDPSSHNVDNFGSWTGDTVYGNASFCDFNGNCNNITAGTFNNVGQWTFNGAVTAPEPTSMAMIGIGILGLGASRRRRA